MTTTETHQLTIARAIAYEIERHAGEPGWATESMRGGPHGERPPRPLTTLADARAQWVASGGDPERGLCFHWCSGDGDRIAWSVGEDGTVHVRVGKMEWWSDGTVGLRNGGRWKILPDDLDLLARIIRAVEEVTRAT